MGSAGHQRLISGPVQGPLQEPRVAPVAWQEPERTEYETVLSVIRTRPLLLTVSLALVLGACGSGGTAAPASVAPIANPTADPTVAGATPITATTAPGAGSDAAGACSIVTSGAVSTASGFSVDAASGTDSICMFQNADKSKYLSLKWDRSQAEMSMMLQIEPGSDHIAGLGDDAFWSPTGLLFVRKGDHALELLDPDMADIASGGTTFRDAMVALARAALPNV